MSLTAGKSALQSALEAMYNNIGSEVSVPVFAKKKAQAIYDFVLTGMPMTIITTFPGPVVGAMTAGPVSGTGLGGFDKPAPGMGLSAAKPILEQDLIAMWTHGNSAKSAAEQAQKEATAIFNYYSQAIIMTTELTAGPLPAPPPVGPVTGPIIGIGGVVSAAPGTGYSSAKPILEAELIRIWSQIRSEVSIASFAKDIATAIDAFCVQGKVDMIGTFSAPAVVALPPAPPNGSYMAGTGASIAGVVS